MQPPHKAEHASGMYDKHPLGVKVVLQPDETEDHTRLRGRDNSGYS